MAVFVVPVGSYAFWSGFRHHGKWHILLTGLFGLSLIGIGAALPDQTGIAACDDYLSSYLACHRAAGIFAPDQLQSRYEAMRTNLLRDSQNPDVRPQLAERCNSLARSLRDALHGKSCAANPAPAASSP